ncbi:MAG: branched-chain amino acid ABC transporter permease [Proteobacteria bacterium]|nr:branched-chain amino acid ABC transporter permease [Pseudomonadota bacterium]
MNTSLRKDFAFALAGFLALALLPALTSSTALLDFVIRCAALGLFATSLNLLVGYGGMVSFGHGLFFGLGAYSFGIIMQRLGMPIPLAILVTVIFSGLVALVVGAICVRLTEIYFAFVTLAFQMLVHSLIIALSQFTGGDQGLRGGIPRPTFFGINLADHSQLYLFCAGLLVIGLLLMRHIVSSPFGYTLRMVRDNAKRAGFLGINVYRTRLTAFVLAGMFASLGGVVMSLFVSGAYPEFAFWTMSGEAVFIVMLGGTAAFLGPLVGTVVLLLLNDYVTRIAEHHGLVLGLVILFVALGLRKGLLDYVMDWRAARRIRAEEAHPVSALKGD